MAPHEHGCRLEDAHCDFSDAQLLVVRLLGGDERSTRPQHEANTRARNKICQNSAMSTISAPSKRIDRERRDEVCEQIIQRQWHLTFMGAGSKTLTVLPATLSCSWYAFSAEMIGAHDNSMK